MPNRTGFRERLKQALGSQYGVKAKVAARSGISTAKLNSYLTGSLPALDVGLRLAKASGVSVEWLVEGKGPRTPDSGRPQIVVGMLGEDAGADTLAIPCPAVANAGEAIIPEEYLDKHSEKHYLFRKRFLNRLNAHADWICILIDEREGESMMPTLIPGDLILVDRNLKSFLGSRKELSKLNGTLALLADPDTSGLFVKRIWIEKEGRLIAHSDNRAFAPKTYSLKDQDIHRLIAGRVVWRGHKL